MSKYEKYYRLTTRDGLKSEHLKVLHDYRPSIRNALKPSFSAIKFTEISAAPLDELEVNEREYRLKNITYAEIYEYEEK